MSLGTPIKCWARNHALERVGADYLAHQQIVGTVVARLRR
jgi:hypothetical protein